MPKRSPKSSQDVQKLLDERQAVIQWLERLSQAGDKASDEVRTKVRADYETRLNAVTEELQGYADELRDSLAAERAKREDLAEKERSADTRLAEAKLRHAVGEYDESRWKVVEAEIEGELTKARDALQVAEGEVERLSDILAAIDGKSDTEERGGEMSDEERVSLAELDPDADGELETLEPETGAAGAEPGTGEATRGTRQTDAFDELAFLKKVAPEGLGKRRRSGATFKPIDPDEIPKPTPTPAQDVTATAPDQTPGVGPKEDETAKKTLKCQECGAMNRPTEWYCESCGAELAAV